MKLYFKMKGDDVILQQSRTQNDESKSEITSKFKHTTKSKKKTFYLLLIISDTRPQHENTKH